MDRSGDGFWKCRVKLISYPTFTRDATDRMPGAHGRGRASARRIDPADPVSGGYSLPHPSGSNSNSTVAQPITHLN